MFRELKNKYPGIDVRTIHHFEGFRIRYYYDNYDDFTICKYSGDRQEKNIKKLNEFISKILKQTFGDTKINGSIIVCIGENKKINGAFLDKNFPKDIKELFKMKEIDIIKDDGFYFAIFDIKNIHPKHIYKIIYYLIIADTDFFNADGNNLGNVYLYDDKMTKLVNLYDDRGMDICYEKPETHLQ